MRKNISFNLHGVRSVLECMASGTPIEVILDMNESEDDCIEVCSSSSCLLLELKAVTGETGLLATLEFKAEDLPEDLLPGAHIVYFREAYYFAGAEIPDSMRPSS